MNVPYNDLQLHHAPLQGELERALLEVSRSGQYVSGERVEAFEEDFAKYCDAEHCVAVGNGTEALWLALRGLDIGPGDEVITVPNTYFSTVEAICLTGATPVFVDVDPLHHLIDVSQIESVITSRTAAILPVHLFGQPAPMEKIQALANQHGLAVIEDAAQAHGATVEGRKVGSGVACFSFYPGKNLGALGEAGAITVSSADLAGKLRSIRNHGQLGKHQHLHLGWNCRMDEIQAAVLSVKLPYLDQWNALRRTCAARYTAEFTMAQGIATPCERENARHVYHCYSLLVEDRDELQAYLSEHGVETSCHYPTPIHLQPSAASFGYRQGDFPITEDSVKKFLSLPLFPEMTPTQIAHVTNCVKSFTLPKLLAS